MASPIWIEKEKRWSIRFQVHGIQKRFTSSRPGIAGKKEVLKKYRAYRDGDTYQDLLFFEAWDKFLAYIVDKNGNVAARFEPTADMAKVEECIKSLL